MWGIIAYENCGDAVTRMPFIQLATGNKLLLDCYEQAGNYQRVLGCSMSAHLTQGIAQVLYALQDSVLKEQSHHIQ